MNYKQFVQEGYPRYCVAIGTRADEEEWESYQYLRALRSQLPSAIYIILEDET